MKRLIRYLKPYTKWVVLAIALTVGVALLSTVRPYLTKIAIDDYIVNKDAQGLKNIILVLLGTLILQGLLQYTMTYLTQWIGQKTIFDLRMELFRHIQKFSMKFFDKNPVGRLVTRLTNDIEVLNEMFSSGIVMVFADVFIIGGILFFMFSLSWQLTLIALSVVFPLIYATVIFRKKVRIAFRDVRFYLAKMNSFLQEHISGILVVKIFNKEKRTLNDFKKINYDHTKANKKSVFYYSVFFPVVELIGALSGALIIWYGGGEAVQGALTIGILISFIQYSEMFFRPIRDLSEKYNIMQTAMASSERIFRLLDRQPVINDPLKPAELGDCRGNIEFRNVWFAYVKEDYVLRDISFKINQGEKVAFVGATGAGKSSIMNLLCRFYDTQKGEIAIDGINIKDLKQNELRRNIGLVVQDIFLFSDSIANNISLNNNDISPEKIREAASIIGINNFIDKLPLGYGQNVKERGVTLSQGERQLITFARALAYDPKILILDEATSSVDTHSEILIQKAIDKLMDGRTSIIIAHRLSTIQKCDKIIVMHKGEIRETGTHQQLLEYGGIYSKLYQLQYKESFA
ncbi:MAG TPA: ABC transporter ATP-binding protein [Ignavibacteria bacterium]|nr:ABC transporter ATP-binding protein [Ignavibacteria bacterium]HRF66791.1 ABC transporter ATP-binding protein [Ignavibacteria bacterium]HRJ04391.1 ABC transporter ATP-binding protein [Ignavibacteria bacterium]HRJ84976.1 ABC transporter ATP-binding protein [Ignavibacteria bacterium]